MVGNVKGNAVKICLKIELISFETVFGLLIYRRLLKILAFKILIAVFDPFVITEEGVFRGF